MSQFVIDGRHIQNHFPGIGRYVFNLALNLARVAPDERFRLVLGPGQLNTRFNLAALESLPNVEVVRMDAPVRSVGEQLLSINRRLTTGATLWHSAYYVFPYALSMPVVVTLEDVMPLVLPEALPSAPGRFLYRALTSFAARRASHLITLSNSAQADIRRALGVPPAKMTVVALAADEGFHPRGSKEIESAREKLNLPERYSLYLGSNKPHKNLVTLIHAWAQLADDSVLVIAGHWDGRYPEAKRLVEQLGLGERVLFRQGISSDDVPCLLSGAQIFAFPSLYEGFGLPPLEAMASGTPVACSNASSLPEVVGEAAVLFDPHDVDAMAESISLFLGDSALRDSLREKGLEQARRFSWERTALQTLEVYKKVSLR